MNKLSVLLLLCPPTNIIIQSSEYTQICENKLRKYSVYYISQER